MFRHAYTSGVLVLAGLLAEIAGPAAAQVIDAEPHPMPFPVLTAAEYMIDPHNDTTTDRFRLAEGALQLRSTAAGFIDAMAFCECPERHWGPVSVVSCSLAVSGAPERTGLALPARISLKDLPMGSTVTLRMLVQAPLIILDLQGNPSAVLDTFVEEYHWRLTDIRRSQPPIASID